MNWFFNVYTFTGAIALAVAFPPFWLVIIGIAIWIYQDIQNDKKRNRVIAEKIRKEKEDEEKLREEKINSLESRINKGSNKAVYELAEYYHNEYRVDESVKLYKQAALDRESNKAIEVISDQEFSRCCYMLAEYYKKRYFDKPEYSRNSDDIYNSLQWLSKFKYKASARTEAMNDIFSSVEKEVELIEKKRAEEIAEKERREKEWSHDFLSLLSPDSNLNLNRMLPYKKYIECCESEPEAILLQEFINHMNLKPGSDFSLRSGTFTLETQVEIQTYRVDFLINRNLVVEVDGKSYHDNEFSFEYDKYRDQNLMIAGYKVVRLPAIQIYRECSSAVEKLLKISNQKYT